MTDEETNRSDQDPEPLQEQEVEAVHTGPLPDLPDSAYPEDATPLEPADEPSLDKGDEDPDNLAGDFTDPDVDLDALLGAPADDEDGEG